MTKSDTQLTTALLLLGGIGLVVLIVINLSKVSAGRNVTFSFQNDGVGYMTVTWPGLATPYTFSSGQNTIPIPTDIEVTVIYTPTDSRYVFSHFYTNLGNLSTNPLMFNSSTSVFNYINAVTYMV